MRYNHIVQMCVCIFLLGLPIFIRKGIHFRKRHKQNILIAAEDNKLKIGKNQIYRIMNLIAESDRDGMSLARYAYTLARMQPNNKKLLPVYEGFSSQMYAWMKNKKDRRELNTALNLLVYYLREDKEA